MRLAFFRGPVLAGLLAAAIVSLGIAQPAGRGDKPGDKKPAAAPAYPPSTVIGVFESVEDAMRKHPDFYLVKRERYKELEDAEKQLAALLARPRPLATTPSKCVIKGKVDGGLVHLQVQFEFDTQKPGEIVRLACGLGNATGATLDGRTPALLGGGRARLTPAKGRPGDDEPEGFSVCVEEPRDHQLTLDLVLAVTARTAGQAAATQGFVLDLPHAAVTRLELDLPPGSGDVHVGGKALAETLLKQKNDQLSGTLGTADRLDLSWKLAQAPSANAVLASEGVIQVRVDNRQVVTEAKLSLRVLSGQARKWDLLVPLKADIQADSGDEGRIARIETHDQKQSSLRTIVLKEPSANPLGITVKSTQPAPKPGAGRPAPIGPFSVVGAARQSGSVLVSNTVADWHLEFTPHGDLTRRGATDDELRREAALVAAFRYGPVGGDRAGAISWVDLEAQNVRGQIKTRSDHLLSLETDGDGPRWQVKTTILVTPRWADVDRFTVLIPEGCEFNSEGSDPLPERVRGLNYDKAGRRVEFRLTRGLAEPTLQPFTVKIEGTYSAAVNPTAAGRATLTLPRPEGTIEQDGTLTVKVPRNLALGSDFETTGGLELQRQTTHELSWRCPRRSSAAPMWVEVSWQPYRPPVSISSRVNLTLTSQEGQVRHELVYHLPEPALAPSRLLLRVPAAAVPSLRVLSGGRLVSAAASGEPLPAAGGGYRLFELRPPATPASAKPDDKGGSRQLTLDLEYSFPLQMRPAERFGVPLVAPDVPSPGDVRVRIWSDSNCLPSAPAPGWSEQNIEEVPDRPSLPVLVLRSSRSDLPLTLQCGEASAAYTVLIDRALVRVDIGEGGLHTYRVSYHLSRLVARHLDFELPAPVGVVSLIATLDGKRVEYEPIAAERPELKLRLARLRLSPDLVRKPAVLELTYQLTPDRTDSTQVSSVLQAPRLLGEAGGVSTRWQITAPPGWVVIAPEAGPATGRTWGWRGWLLAPRSSLTGADLERWLIGGEPAASVVEATSGLTPSLVLWRDGTSTVLMTHTLQLNWMLVCSLVLVLLGLMLWRLPLPSSAGVGVPVWAWLVLSGAVASVVLGVLLWPSLAGQVVYGCQPGAAVLLVLAGMQWLLHERYRRQLVFLPSFSRPRTGSSLIRQEAARAAHGEPSTVDVPRPTGSSIDRR